MKKWLNIGILAALLLVTGLAQAQCPPSTVNRVPGTAILDAAGAMLVNTAGRQCTYTAALVAVVPASSATDVACLNGSSTKTVGLNRVRVSGTAGTLVTLPIQLRKNVSLDTGGVGPAATVLVGPTKHQTGFNAATATATAYTTNPTINDTAPGAIGIQTVTLPTTSGAIVAQAAEFNFGNRGGEARPTLSAAAQQFCVYLSAVTVSSGLLYVDFTWTED